MERRRITCPETGHLEEIEVEPTRAGILVVSCSRFTPCSALDCPRECARRIDRRTRRDSDDYTERVLVVVETLGGGVAARLADLLRADGFIVDVADLTAGGAPPPDDYEAIVLASGPGDRAIAGYLAEHGRAIAAMPSFQLAETDADLPALALRIADEVPAI